MSNGPNYREGGYAGRPTPCAPLNGARVLRPSTAGAGIVGQPGSYIPHGEGSGRNNPWPEDTLPSPRCVECSDRIYYERGIWWHAELENDRQHAAEPKEIA